jgi:hypothetical protein
MRKEKVVSFMALEYLLHAPTMINSCYCLKIIVKHYLDESFSLNWPMFFFWINLDVCFTCIMMATDEFCTSFFV